MGVGEEPAAGGFGEEGAERGAAPRRREPQVRVAYRLVKAAAADADAGGERDAARRDDPFIRAANEDDDGYDPYSDRRETLPLFEEDPWR